MGRAVVNLEIVLSTLKQLKKIMTKYNLKKGNHYPSPLFIKGIITSPNLSGCFQITPECWYDTKVIGTHLNKLVGFTLDPLKLDSIRIAWRPGVKVGMFELYAYKHDDGKWVRSKPLKADLIGIVDSSHYNFSLHNYYISDKVTNELTEEGIKIKVSNLTSLSFEHNVIMPNNMLTFGWVQGPYFGGVPTAPNDMSIYVQIF